LYQVSKADEPLGMMELHYVEAARNRGNGVKTLRFTATIVLALVLFGALSAPASAQTVNRTNVPAGEAVPTGGTFSIRFPTAFTDLEARAKADTPGGTDAVVRMLTGLNGDGVRFSATETPFPTGQQLRPIEDFMEAAKQRPRAVVTDVHRDHQGDTDILSFTLDDFKGGTYFHIARTKAAQYMQVIQFPESQRDKATAMKDDFFGSFKVTQ
jgi:hypothetical protein